MDIKEGDYVVFNKKRIMSGKGLRWGFTREAKGHINKGNKPMKVHDSGCEGAEVKCPEFSKNSTLSVDYGSLIKINNKKIRRI